MDRAELERLDRESLVVRAQAAGIRRARVLTRPELIDELLRLDPAADQTQLKRSRGFFGVARDLLSRVVERGLHLPDAADRLRAALGSPLPQVPRPEPQAVPTVTLAEIYAAQGHKLRAVETLWRVLEAEPEHAAARALLEKLNALDYVPPPPMAPEGEEAVGGDEIGAHLRGEAFAEAPTVEVSAMDHAVAAAQAQEMGEAATVETSVVERPLPEAPTIEPALDAAALEEGAPPSPLAESAPPPEHEELEVVTPRIIEAPTTLPLATVPSECVAIPIEGGRFYVWWRLGTDARRLVDEAFFFVRAVIFVPTWEGPQRETRDVACDPTTGELVLGAMPDGAVVRIAIGVMEAGDVVPLAHSPALEVTPSQGLVQWTPEGALPIALEDPRASAIARAAEGAARSGHVSYDSYLRHPPSEPG
jgi:hypothetical protein